MFSSTTKSLLRLYQCIDNQGNDITIGHHFSPPYKIENSSQHLNEFVAQLFCDAGKASSKIVQHLKGDGVVNLFWSNLITLLFQTLRVVCRLNVIISRSE
jgi:hypothetical protein